jgi:uncharacterized membrane protein YfcA
MLIRIILTLLIGSIAGIIGGAFGQVGTFIILPALLILNVISDYKTAVGTILLAMLPPISALAVVDYYKHKKIDFLVAALLCVSYTIAAKYGAVINNRFSSKTLKGWTAVTFIIVGIYFAWTAYYGGSAP